MQPLPEVVYELISTVAQDEVTLFPTPLASSENEAYITRDEVDEEYET